MTMTALRAPRSPGGALGRLLIGQMMKVALTVALFVIVARADGPTGLRCWALTSRRWWCSGSCRACGRARRAVRRIERTGSGQGSKMAANTARSTLHRPRRTTSSITSSTTGGGRGVSGLVHVDTLVMSALLAAIVAFVLWRAARRPPPACRRSFVGFIEMIVRVRRHLGRRDVPRRPRFLAALVADAVHVDRRDEHDGPPAARPAVEHRRRSPATSTRTGASCPPPT